MSGGKKNVDCW